MRINIERGFTLTKGLHKINNEINDVVGNKILVLENIKKSVESSIAKNKPLPIFKNLISLVSDQDILMLAFSNLKSNQGNVTAKTTEILDNMLRKRIKNLSGKIKNATYRFPTSGKRIKLGKTTLPKFEKISEISKADSKLIQESLRLILNSIYEPLFNSINANYGFREKLRSQDALITFCSKAKGLNYVIEGDISDMFCNLDYKILIGQISRRVSDKEFLILIYDCCNSGIFDDLQNCITDPLTGVPLRGILSPLLWNIYMMDFDEYILEEIKKTYDILNKRKDRILTAVLPANGTYKKIKDFHYIKKQCAITSETELKEFNTELCNIRRKNQKKLSVRFYYLRYAGYWLFFTNLKLGFLKIIKNKITTFFKDYLKFMIPDEKVKVKNMLKNRVKFLGYSLSKRLNQKMIKGQCEGITRITNDKLIIGIDKDRVLDQLLSRGYIDYRGKPREQSSISTLSIYEIIMRYNLLVRRYTNYYAPIIDCRSDINYIVHILEYSCYKTICQKNRTTIKKLLKSQSCPLTAIYEKSSTESSKKTKLKKKHITLLTTKIYWKILENNCKRIRYNLTHKSGK